MPTYCIFKKGNHVNALERNDLKGAACLREWGYSKQSEEINAPDTHYALARFNDICNKEQVSEHAISTGAAIEALLMGLITFVGWFFL